jgi:hypothetical protein
VSCGTTSTTDPVTITALVFGVVLLAGFVVNEWRARQPIMPLRLFASRERTAAYLGRPAVSDPPQPVLVDANPVLVSAEHISPTKPSAGGR